MEKRIKTKIKSEKFIDFFAYGIIIVFTIICLYPLLLTLMVSLSDEYLVQIHGFKLIPEKFSLATYKFIFDSSSDKILNAYLVTVAVTAAGTLLGLIVCSMLAYTLSQKHIKYRNVLSFFFYFTIIFPAGMLPWYIVCINVLHIKDTFWALILPYTVNVWNAFLLRNYFQSIPDSIAESAKIDGANDFFIYARLIVPMSRTAILTVLMFFAVQYWNDWWLAIMLISKRTLYPMQYFLFDLLTSANALSSGHISDAGGKISIPTETIKMAVTIITITPLMIIFPFVKKYFVHGIVIGAVKG